MTSDEKLIEAIQTAVEAFLTDCTVHKDDFSFDKLDLKKKVIHLASKDELANISSAWNKGEGISDIGLEGTTSPRCLPTASSEMHDSPEISQTSSDSGILNNVDEVSSSETLTQDEEDDEFVYNEDNDGDDVDDNSEDDDDDNSKDDDTKDDDDDDDNSEDDDDNDDDDDDDEDDGSDDDDDDEDEEDEDDDDYDIDFNIPDGIPDDRNDIQIQVDVQIDESGENNLDVDANYLNDDSGNEEDDPTEAAAALPEAPLNNEQPIPNPEPAQEPTQKPTQEPTAEAEKKVEPQPPIEFIIGRRTVNGMVQYLCQRTGHGELQSTWEPVETLTCHDLVAAYENDRSFRFDNGNRRQASIFSRVRNL